MIATAHATGVSFGVRDFACRIESAHMQDVIT